MTELAIRGGTRAVRTDGAVRWPVLGEEERRAVLRVLESGILCGARAPELRSLEEEFARFTGTRFCLATNSGTAALHMAVAATGAGPGDEIITSAFTYPATALVILQQGATPVFADIDPATFNIDPVDVERRVTPRTRALMPVHIHGLPCDMEAIGAVARRHDLLVIEDAAQAHGATYRSRPVGSLGDMAAFSLNATKNLPCGEGGLFVTDREALRDRAAAFRVLGQTRDEVPLDAEHPLDGAGDSEFDGPGLMYLTQELPAAIARVQLRRLEAFNANAAANAAVLTSRLRQLPGIVPPSCPADRTHVFHKYRVRIDPRALGLAIDPARLRDAIMAALHAEGVEVMRWLDKPVPEMPVFARRSGEPAGAYPRTSGIIADSFVVGSQTFPLFPQPRALMEQYADAFEKVMTRASSLAAESGKG